MTSWTNKYKQTYSTKTYSWGDLRVLRMGNAYTCIIHPEHMEAINRGEAFTDEQGYRWETAIADGVVTLKHNSSVFTIPLAELNA